MENGCAVVFYAKHLDYEFAKNTLPKEVVVKKSLSEISESDLDVACVHHNLVAIEIRHAMPDLPMVFCSLGVIPFLEHPPALNTGISRYIAISEEIRQHLIREGIEKNKISVIGNSISPSLFYCERTPYYPPKKILVISNRIGGEQAITIKNAAAITNSKFTFIGEAGTTHDNENLRQLINDSDLVIGIGRGVLEGIFCGRPAVVYDHLGGDGAVNEETYADIKFSNFSGRLLRKSFTPEELSREILKVTPDAANRTRNLALADYSIKKNIKKYIHEFELAIQNNRPLSPPERKLISFFIEAQSETLGWHERFKNIATTRTQKNSYGGTTSSRCAVIIHLYYVDLWNDIKKQIASIPEPADIFITAPLEKKPEIDILNIDNARIFYFENRGRDVLPFLKLLHSGALDSYRYVCKLHTKKSPHLSDGDQWRERLLEGLLGDVATVNSTFSAFETTHDIGLIAPRGALLDVRHGISLNQTWLDRLSRDFAISWNAYHYQFPVGTMFWFRPEALKDAKRLADYPFEDEHGQVDGCLHHAVERFLPLLAVKDGFRTISLEDCELKNPLPMWIHRTNIYQKWLADRSRASQQQMVECEPVADVEMATLTLVIYSHQNRHNDTAGTLASALNLSSERVSISVVTAESAPTNPSDRVSHIHADDFSASLKAILQTKPGGWICFLSAGDQLNADMLPYLLQRLSHCGDIGMVYCDEDAITPEIGPSSPAFKPDFDIDFLRSSAFTGRFLILRNTEYLELQGLQGLESWSFLDYALKFYERYGAAAIGHLPEIMFHAPPERDDETVTAARKYVVQQHLRRSGLSAEVRDGLIPGSFRIVYQHETRPLVSIIIPTRNQMAMLSRCIESLTEKTSYPNYEILLIDNQSTEEDAKSYLQGIVDLGMSQLRVLRYPAVFNYSAMNNLAAREARGEYLVLLNNDTAIIQADWLEAMLNHAQRPEVGVVGAKLLYPDGGVQHAGVILGLRGPAEHPFLGAALNEPGYMGRLQVDQQYSAVTAACMMIRKSIFDAVGGLDEDEFKVSYNDIDLCLKVKSAGYSILWTPHALVMHVGSASQKTSKQASLEEKRQRFKSEKQAMYRKWMPVLANDPAYNPNLSLSGTGFELETSALFQRVPAGLRKVYALCADSFGSGLYRTIAPTSALVEAGYAMGACGRAYLAPVDAVKADPDTIVFQRQITEPQIEYIQDYRNYTRAKLIFELDDYLPNLPVASLHKNAMPKDVMRNMRRAMDLCDRVVVSTEALKHTLEKLHPEIIVLPNYLPTSLWGKLPAQTPRFHSQKPRVGWAGGVGHTGDLRLIADLVRALSDRVDWVFFGMLPEGVQRHVAEYHPGVNIADYPERLAMLDLDLALAPLEDNRFNACKSNLRLLEYGICGYPVIASDCEPYRCELPVTLVKNRFKDWLEAVEDKLADRDALRREGEALQSAVRQGWMLEGDNLLRWQDGWLLSAR